MNEKIHLILIRSVMELLYLIFPLCSLHIFTRIIPSGNLYAIYGIALPVFISIIYTYWLSLCITDIVVKYKNLNYKISLMWSIVFIGLLSLLHVTIFVCSLGLIGIVFLVGCFLTKCTDLDLRHSILHIFSFIGMILGVVLIILGYGTIGTLIAANVIYSKVFRVFLDLPLMLYHFIYNERGELCKK